MFFLKSKYMLNINIFQIQTFLFYCDIDKNISCATSIGGLAKRQVEFVPNFVYLSSVKNHFSLQALGINDNFMYVCII